MAHRISALLVLLVLSVFLGTAAIHANKIEPERLRVFLDGGYIELSQRPCSRGLIIASAPVQVRPLLRDGMGVITDKALAAQLGYEEFPVCYLMDEQSGELIIGNELGGVFRLPLVLVEKVK